MEKERIVKECKEKVIF